MSSQIRVFISYRRADSGEVVGRIYDWLERRCGHDSVFRDVDSIPVGIDFRDHLKVMMRDCTAAVVVIGPRWLTETTQRGERRIDDPRDHVRLEIEDLLLRDIPVVPLLVLGASLPTSEELPATISDLAFRNAAMIRPDPDFRRDMDRVIAAISTANPSAPAGPPRGIASSKLIAVGFVALACVAIVAGLAQFRRQAGESAQSTQAAAVGASPLAPSKTGLSTVESEGDETDIAPFEAFSAPGADLEALTLELRPLADDYLAVLKPDLVEDWSKVYEQWWGRAVTRRFSVRPDPEATGGELRVRTAAEAFATDHGLDSPFRPEVQLYTLTFVAPDGARGTSYTGLIKINGHWRMFPRVVPVERRVGSPEFKPPTREAEFRERVESNLVLESSTRKSPALDVEEWMALNRLERDSLGNSTDSVGEELEDLIWTRAEESHLTLHGGVDGVFRSADYYVLVVDDRTAVILIPRSIERPAYRLDFSEWRGRFYANKTSLDPELANGIRWATHADGLLYIAYGGDGSAVDWRSRTGYLAAIDIENGWHQWLSDPLVSYASFQIAGDLILTGYGDESGASFLYAISRVDGTVVDRIPIRCPPLAVATRDGKAFALCSDGTEYVFRFE